MDFDGRFPELKALFEACKDRKAVLALAKRIRKQLMGDEPQSVPMCWGAFEDFKAAALAIHRQPEVVKMQSGRDMRVAMADRYLSRSNRVGRLR